MTYTATRLTYININSSVLTELLSQGHDVSLHRYLRISENQFSSDSYGFTGLFFLNQHMHDTVFKKHISGISRYFRTIRYVYTTPYNAIQQLRSQKQSGSSAPQVDLVTNWDVCPVPGAKLGTWCQPSFLCLLLHCTVQNYPVTFTHEFYHKLQKNTINFI